MIVNMLPSSTTPGAWRVLEAFYSAHYGELTDSSGWVSGLAATAIMDGYPASFVAIGKHANYVTMEDCDFGAFLADSCADNVFAGEWTMPAGSNIGNRYLGSILQNCVVSRIGFPGFECLWATTGSFRGWSGDFSSAGSTEYGDLLDDFDF